VKLILRPLAPGELDLELLFASLLIASICIGWFVLKTDLPLPACPLKATIDLPCAACGSTRAIRAMSEGHPLQAFLLNPLTALATITGIGWGLYAVSVAGRPVPRWRLLTLTNWSRWALLLLIGANWAYVIYRHG